MTWWYSLGPSLAKCSLTSSITSEIVTSDPMPFEPSSLLHLVHWREQEVALEVTQSWHPSPINDVSSSKNRLGHPDIYSARRHKTTTTTKTAVHVWRAMRGGWMNPIWRGSNHSVYDLYPVYNGEKNSRGKRRGCVRRVNVLISQEEDDRLRLLPRKCPDWEMMCL